MSAGPGKGLRAKQDEGIGFIVAEPDDLDRVVSVPQASDNQWMPDELLTKAMGAERLSDDKVERLREPHVRREYLRALVNTGQIVINRAFLYNNPAIFRDYAKPGRAREDFKQLLNDRVIIPYLFKEPSPATKPVFTRRDVGWEGWTQVLADSEPTCLRLSWESDGLNDTQVSRLLAIPTAKFIETMSYFEAPLLAAELGLSGDEVAAFANRLREVAFWAHRRSEAGESLNREDLYRAFVVADNTDPADRQYDADKPFSAAIKKIIDLRYNANLTDALGSFLVTPEDSLRRRALQEWRDDRRGGGMADADRLIRVIANLRFDQISEVVGALAAFEQLTLGGIIDLRSTREWARYHEVLRDFLTEPTLDAFGNAEHGVEAVALAYGEVIRQAGAIAVSHTASRLQERWDPVVEIMVEFAGAVVSIFYDPAGDGGKAFHVARELMQGVVTREAKAAFHLIIGRVTRSRGQSRVDNSLRVLETGLEHGKNDWIAFVGALRAEGFRELDQVPGTPPETAAMEKNTQT